MCRKREEEAILERAKAQVLELVDEAGKAADIGDLYAMLQRLRDAEQIAAHAWRRIEGLRRSEPSSD